MFEQQFISELANAVATAVVAQMASPSGPQRRLLTVEQAAEYIGRSKQATYILINQGKLPVKRQGSRVFIDRLVLDAWIDALED